MDKIVLPYGDLSFTYYETSVIINSVQRILKILSKMKISDLKSAESSSLLEIINDDNIKNLKNFLDGINEIENGKKILLGYVFLEFFNVYKDSKNLIEYIKSNFVNGLVVRESESNCSDTTESPHNSELIKCLKK